MRNIPTALQEHLDQSANTTTRLLKIKLRDGFSYGLAMCDVDVDYDDGDGEITYVATNGFDASTFAADTGYTVNNAEGYALISDEVEGIDADDVKTGRLDDAEWICYLVNVENLTMGHAILDAGDVGEVRTRFGMVWMPELVSYIMRLKQPVGSVWSRTCRAIFGTNANSQTGCGVNANALWINGTVLSVGPETNRVFVGSAMAGDSPDHGNYPNRVQFLTGDNAGKTFSTELIEDDTFTLAETTPYPILPGDAYRTRPDCAKRYEEDCIGRYNNGPNFKGEPHIPVGDAVSGQTPGAQLGSGSQNQGRGSDDK